MNNREKFLLGAGGFVAFLVVLGLAVRMVFILPADDCNAQAREWEKKIAAAEAMKAKEAQYKTHMADLAGHTFGDDDMVVSEQVRTTVTGLLEMSGLSTQNLSLKPLLGTRVPNVYREIGWSVQTRGKLEQVVRFLYLMTKETHLHRVDNIVLSPALGGEVSLQVKYATLLLETPALEVEVETATGKSKTKLATNLVKDQVLDAEILNTDEAHLYDIIADRDLFRPFIERRRPPVVAVAPVTGGAGGAGPVRTVESRTGGDRIVGLPTYDGVPEVDIVNTASGKLTTYKQGDSLAGGRIVMIDYRLMPSPRNPEDISESRIILRIGTEYYAVELGQVLTERRALAPADWPPGLPKLQTVDTGPAPTATAPALTPTALVPMSTAPTPTAPAANKK